jgi:flagellar FliL protein
MPDNLLDDENISLGEEEDSKLEKKFGFFPQILIQILKYVAMGLGAIIFIVTVVIITIRIMNAGAQPLSYAMVSADYQATPPLLVWYDLGEVRGRTGDDTNNTFLVVPRLGYNIDDKALQIELSERKPKLRDISRTYFSSKVATELRPANEVVLKEELKNKINDVLAKGKINEVIFDDFNVVEF